MTRIRTQFQRNSDRGISTMLSLLLVSRCGSPTEIIAYEFELTDRAIKGAKQGDG